MDERYSHIRAFPLSKLLWIKFCSKGWQAFLYTYNCSLPSWNPQIYIHALRVSQVFSWEGVRKYVMHVHTVGSIPFSTNTWAILQSKLLILWVTLRLTPLALSEHEIFETLIKVHQINILPTLIYDDHGFLGNNSWFFRISFLSTKRLSPLHRCPLEGENPHILERCEMFSRNHNKWNPLSFNSLSRTHKPTPERLYSQQTFIFKGGGLRFQVFNDCILTHEAKKAFWTMIPCSLHEAWPHVHWFVQLDCLCKTNCLFKLATHMDSTS